MNIYADTDIGMVRKMNQDSYYISEENDMVWADIQEEK